jgi:pimeloyl-ACP methyl ester carboxylesterase
MARSLPTGSDAGTSGGRATPREYSEGVSVEVPQSRWADLGGPVHYVRWDGPEDRTFVLVHGLGGSLLSWLAVAPSLSRHGRVFALDLAGFGRTPRAGRRSRVSDARVLLSRFVSEVVGDGAVVLCGNSMGGSVAMLQAALEPESVEGLVLSNSVFPWVRGAYPAPIVMLGFGVYQLPRVGEWASRQRLSRLEAERAVRFGLRIIASDPSTIDPELVRLHVEMFQRQRDDPDAAPAFLEAARSLMALGRRPRTARWILDAVRCPVLVIHGRRDRLVPIHYAHRALEVHPLWEMRTIPKVGHIPQMEAPDRWLGAVAGWLERLPVASRV